MTLPMPEPDDAKVLWQSDQFRIVERGRESVLQSVVLPYLGDTANGEEYEVYEWEDVDCDEIEYREMKKDAVIEALLDDLMHTQHGITSWLRRHGCRI